MADGPNRGPNMPEKKNCWIDLKKKEVALLLMYPLHCVAVTNSAGHSQLYTGLIQPGPNFDG